MGSVGKSIGGFFGGSDGETAGLQRGADPAAAQLEGMRHMGSDRALRSLFDSYQSGQTSKGQFEEAVRNNLQGRGFSPDMQENALMQFQSDYDQDPTRLLSQSTKDVQENDILGQLFGKEGALSRANQEEQRLASQGFNLTPEDHEAYGQSAGDIARLFGQQEKSATSSLARRGLGGAESGAAVAAFSGLAGNKNEQLAKAQMDIAKQRYADNMQRLQNTRSFMQGLGGQAQQALNSRYDQRQGASGRKRNELLQLAELQQKQQQIGNAAAQGEFDNQQNTRKGGLFESFGEGLKSSAFQIGSAPGKVASSAAGKMGGGMFGG